MHKKFRHTKKRFFAIKQKKIRKLKLLSHHPVAVPVATFFVLISLTIILFFVFGDSGKINVSSKIVIISHDGVQQTVPTREPTVGTLLQKLQLHLNQGDIVEPDVTSPINQDDFRINIYRAVPVEIVDGQTHTFTFSAATTPRSIVEQANIAVYPEDKLSTQPTTNFIQEAAIGERVVIDRATPVLLNLYGTQVQIRTHAATVNDLLKERGIKLASTDTVDPAGTTPISQNQLIFILRNGVQINNVTETIPMPVQTEYDANLAFGTQAIRQQGSTGKRINTYQVKTVNGVAVNQTVIQSVIVQPAVTEIVVVGTSLSGIKGDMALAGIGPNDYNYADYIISHESGWCPTKWQGEYGSCPAYHGAPTTSYTGYGLCQATPGYKMQSAGADWATNPVTQLIWCNGYAVAHYSGWAAAYTHWVTYSSW